MKQLNTILLIALFTMLISVQSMAMKNAAFGTIKGMVVDRENQSTIPGVNVLVVDTKRGSITDLNGQYIIKDLPAGTYVLSLSFIGYESQKIADVIVRPDRITFVQAELRTTILEMEGASVTGDFFVTDEVQSTSTIGFSSEEIRRAPGSAGDVSRILYGLPAVAKANDERNNLIVRGGSPIENAFYVDNIEIPNINHFPAQGSSGGAVGMIKVDLIKEVNFHTGGFSAEYGDRLSSIMELTLREGNRDEFDGELDLSMAGAGAVLEGPLFDSKGSWIISARRSYVDLVASFMDFGVAPKYGDFQSKVVYDIDQSDRIALLDVFALDMNRISKKESEKLDFSVYGNDDALQNTLGLSWRHLWGKAGYSVTTVSHSLLKFTTDYFEGRSENLYLKNRSAENSFTLRNDNHVQFNDQQKVSFGGEAKYYTNDYNNFFGLYTTAFGDTTPAFNISKSLTAYRFGTYLSYSMTLIPLLELTFGARIEYFSFHDRVRIDPRAAFCYKISELTYLTGSIGLFHQSLPFFILSQSDNYKNAHDLTAVHYIVGANHLLTEDTKLSLEIYQKNYTYFPLNPDEPSLFALDDIFSGMPYFFKSNNLTDNGRALARGGEVILQKRLAQDFYGMASAAVFSARYQDLNGVWRDRVFNNRMLFSIEGGYKPNSEWEFSVRWIYAGGTPYTPFDLAASRAIDRAVLDQSKVNSLRQNDYHSLNVRVDKRFNFNSSNLVLYLSIWNAYNRKNIAARYWDEFKNEPAIQYQWSIMPIIGVEYEY